MSLLSKAVNFKKLANQLTSTEFDQFLAKIAKDIGKEIILKLLCTPFIKSTSINNNQSLLDNMIKIISNIIQSRKIKENEQNNITKIDEFPSPLIGEISSYLKQKEYSLFSRTNRSIFVSCNTPNTLKEIELFYVANYSFIKLQNYPQITELSFNLEQIDEFQINDQLSFPQLQTMTTDGTDCSNQDIQQFININQNHLNLSNLTVASFTNFSIDFSVFFQLLSQFKMIKNLDLYNVEIDGNVEIDEIRELFPNLTGFSSIYPNTPFLNAILNEYGSNLEYLSISGDHANYKQINFTKLKRLCALKPLNENMNDILQTAKGLKDVVLAPYGRYPHRRMNTENMNVDEISAIINMLVIEQKSLELLYIHLASDIFKSVVASIENGLYKTRNRKRKEFKIKFLINYDDKINLTDFMIYISRIFNVLNVSEIKDFIVIWQCVKDKKYDLSEMLDAMNGLIKSVPNMQLIKATERECIVGNKNCKINGYKNWWNDFFDE